MKTIIKQDTETGRITVYSDDGGLWLRVENRQDDQLGMEISISADQLWSLKNKIVLNDQALQIADKPRVGT